MLKPELPDRTTSHPMHSHTKHSMLDMRLPLLLATFFAIAHAGSYTAYAPAPTLVEDVSPPPPPPKPPAWSSVSPPTPPPAPTGWTPVPDVNLMAIRQVGQFAVRIYALVKQIELVFVNVISGKTQPSDGGYSYQLNIAVDGPGAKSPRYDAVVWGILGTTTWELRSFNATK